MPFPPKSWLQKNVIDCVPPPPQMDDYEFWEGRDQGIYPGYKGGSADEHQQKLEQIYQEALRQRFLNKMAELLKHFLEEQIC